MTNNLYILIQERIIGATDFWNKNLPDTQVFHGFMKPESMQKIEDEIDSKIVAGWCSEKWLETKLDDWSFTVKEWIDAIKAYKEEAAI